MRLNFVGYKFLHHDGYGRMGLNTVRSLIRAGHDVTPFTVDALDMPAWYQLAQGIDFSHATIQLMPPHEFRHIPGRSFGYTMHESMTLPPGWANHINHKCQWLIVPHAWLIPVMEEAGVEVPIEVVGSGIDPDECSITTKPRIHSRPFTFGCLGDRGGRKGNQEVITAFYKAFDHRNKDVRLLSKCRPGSRQQNLDFSYSSDDRFTIWDADVDRISDIYAPMDAFIFPSKCEGWGQPCRESAACAVPTIVTRFSGLDDETDQWAIPLDNYSMVESKMKGSGGKWAQPNIDELVEKMRWLYENQDEAKRNALKAARWLRENRTYDQAAENLVNTMAKYLGGPPEMQEKSTKIPHVQTIHSNGHKPTLEVVA